MSTTTKRTIVWAAPSLWIERLPVLLGKRLGIFDSCDELKNRCVEMKILNGGPELLDWVDKGQCDVGEIGMLPLLTALANPTNAHHDAASKVHIAGTTFIQCLDHYIAARGDSNITAVSDLQGRRVGILSHGSCDSHLLTHILRAEGVDETTVVRVPLGKHYGKECAFEDAALNIDAAFLVEPLLSKMEAQGTAKTIAHAAKYFDTYQWNCLFVSRKFADQDPAAASAVLTCYDECVVRLADAVDGKDAQARNCLADLANETFDVSLDTMLAALRRDKSRWALCHREFSLAGARVCLNGLKAIGSVPNEWELPWKETDRFLKRAWKKTNSSDEQPPTKKVRTDEPVGSNRSSRPACAICLLDAAPASEDELAPQWELVEHGCSTCKAGAWHICASCHDSCLSRRCPICRGLYAPRKFYSFPLHILSQELKGPASIAARQYLATVLKTSNTVVWTPSERTGSFMFLPSSGVGQAHVAAPNFLVPEGMFDSNVAADGAFHFSEPLWDALVEANDEQAEAEEQQQRSSDTSAQRVIIMDVEEHDVINVVLRWLAGRTSEDTEINFSSQIETGERLLLTWSKPRFAEEAVRQMTENVVKSRDRMVTILLGAGVERQAAIDQADKVMCEVLQQSQFV